MIVCVCPSPAIDITYRVQHLVAGATNRVTELAERPGGKGVNVARVLRRIGAETAVLAPLGGSSGAQLCRDLEAFGIPITCAVSGVATRRTVTVVDDRTGEATLLSEPATIDCWAELVARCGELSAAADAVVISGSQPAGAPADGIAELVRAADPRARPVVVDTSGAPLAAALAAQPSCVKPNAAELAALTGSSDPVSAATDLAQLHDVLVVASCGPDGVVAVDRSGTWHARPARPIDGNPTGAGDALVAGLARGLASGAPLPDVLADAVALSAAAVLHPVAGDVDPRDVAAQRDGVVIVAAAGGAR